jgi:predicted transposase YbfD/YdcC
VSEIAELDPKAEWKGLKTVVIVVGEKRSWNKTARQVHCYLNSWTETAEKIAGTVRSQWGIENIVHCTLDVTFVEDKSRIPKNNAPKNFALLRRLALNILPQEQMLAIKEL